MAWVAALAAWAGAPVEQSVPATGRQELVYEADAFGRYAFEVTSPQGTALQLVDKMTGPGAIDGRSGERDGRIDAFLDRGAVKLVALSDPYGEGEAVLRVTPFERLDGLQVLDVGRPVAATLEDRQERAFWVEARDQEIIAFEAVGRFVADIRLWRDGSWLVAAEPECRSIEPTEGQPVVRCQLVARVEGGGYQVSVYGGPGAEWSEAGDDTALHLVRGVPRGAGVGRVRQQIGPTGTDRLRVPKTVGYASVALDDNVPVAVRLRSYSAQAPFATGGSSDRITEDRRLPFAEVREGSDRSKLLTVEGPPGTPYTLTWFDPIGVTTRVEGSGATYVATMLGADASDGPDPTGLLYRHTTAGPDVLARTLGIPLDGKQAYSKRFALSEQVDLILDVRSDGRYLIEAEGLKIRARVEPLLTTHPEGYSPPAAILLPLDEELPEGQVRLTLIPDEPGIATLTVRANNWGAWARRTVGLEAAGSPERPGLQAEVELDSGAPLTLLAPALPGVTSGLVVRDLPLTDLSEPVPVALLPGESWVLPLRLGTDQVLRAHTARGEALPVQADDGPEGDEVLAPVGTSQLTVRNPGAEPVRVLVHAAPGPQPPPLRPAPTPELRAFPELAAGAPTFLDLERSDTRTYQVRVDEPGLYRVVSTGLLATSGTLRSRTRLDLGTGDQNGVGRNFSVARYLRTGDYQLTVTARGQSAGHLGLELMSARVVDGGALTDGVPGRVALQAGEAVHYGFELAEPAQIAVASRSQQRSFQCRVEDGEGWPRTAPSVDCDRTLDLDPGSYGVLVLPEQVPTRRITTMRVQRSAEQREGHGPHELELGTAVRHVWSEPTDGGARTPDTWTFSLPAEAHVQISLGDEMAADLREGDTAVARVTPGRTLKQELPAGSYRLEVRGARKGTGVPYRVRVDTTELVVGTARSVRVPSEVPVSIGSAGLVTLASTGSVDVRARLLDASGEVVAANDDRPDDWNFRISTWLVPGRYTLALEPVGSSGHSTIALSAPAERELSAGPLGKARAIELGGRTVVVPLELPSRRDLIEARLDASETVGIAVEVEAQDGWRTIGRATGRTPAVAVRRPEGAAARLRAWSLDERGGTATLTAWAPNPGSVGASALASGVARSGPEPWPAVRIGGSGLLALGGRTGVLACPRRGEACVPAPPVVPITEDGLVLLGRHLQGRSVDLSAEAVLDLDERPVALPLSEGGLAALTVRAAVGQPGVRVAGGPVALGDRAALALDTDGARRAAIWRASDEAAPVAVRVRVHPLTRVQAQPSSTGRTNVQLDPGTAVELPLSGPSSVRIALEDGTAAALGAQAVWADASSASAELRGSGSVLVLNLSGAQRLVQVDIRPTGQPLQLVGPQAPLELPAGARGVVPFAVAPEPDARLVVDGGALVYLRADGVALRGTDLDVGPGGRAWLSRTSDPVLAWVERDGAPGPWRPVDARPRGLQPGLSTPLEGDAAAVQIALGAAGVAHLRAEAPFAARVEVEGAPDRVAVRPRGGTVDLWLPDGRATVTLRGLGGSALHGEVALASSDAPPIGEGLGPEVLLPPGSSRWFRFSLDDARDVGVGVRADADRVVARVLAPDGTERAAGLVRKVSLEAGTWLVALQQSADGLPVRARPALAGVEPPDTGPPEDVVKGYLERAGFAPDGGTR